MTGLQQIFVFSGNSVAETEEVLEVTPPKASDVPVLDVPVKRKVKGVFKIYVLLQNNENDIRIEYAHNNVMNLILMQTTELLKGRSQTM